MELDRLFRLLVALAILSFAIALLGVAGELLGWWNDLGEILITVAGLSGVALALAALLLGATKSQVLSVANGVQDSNRKLDDSNRKLDDIAVAVGLTRRDIVDRLDRHTDVLVQIRDRL